MFADPRMHLRTPFVKSLVIPMIKFVLSWSANYKVWFITTIGNKNVLIVGRLNMIDSRPVSLPIPLHLSHSRRGLTAKRFRRFTDMRNRRSKIFNLGRTFEQSSPSIVPTSKPEDVSFLCTRSGAKYYRPS